MSNEIKICKCNAENIDEIIRINLWVSLLQYPAWISIRSCWSCWHNKLCLCFA